jgi:glycosyltransferase involved in cell wall biosynthesis
MTLDIHMRLQPDTGAGDVPLVSAIIIFLDGEKYIAEAIESIIAQTMTDWELILVDDGSTDGATEIAKRYAREHPGKIFYTEHPGHENRGMSASRNAGLRLARGKYVGFLDADDIWMPEHLRVNCRILEDNEHVVLVFGRTLFWFSWEDSANQDRLMDVGLPTWRVLEPPVVMQRILDTFGACVPAICSIVARRDAVLETGGFDESFRTLFEDQVFYARMFLNYPSVATDCVLDRYRQHPESTCAKADGPVGDRLVRPRYLAWLDGYLRAQGVDDRAILASFKRNVERIDPPLKARIVKGLKNTARRTVYSLPFGIGPWIDARRSPPPAPQPAPPSAQSIEAALAYRARILDGIEGIHADEVQQPSADGA